MQSEHGRTHCGVVNMYQTNHAEHFLSRIDRLDTRQAELALGLYRDPQLVKFLLDKSPLPGEADRVAIALSEGESGPYVIVTREGRFVTCLGEGMRPHADQPLVTHHRLCHLGSQVQALRTLMNESAGDKSTRCDALLRRVLDAGHALTQDDFDALVAWSPVVGHVYVHGLFSALDGLWTSFRRLRSIKGMGRRTQPLLKAHFKTLWATAHLTMLVGHQPEHLAAVYRTLDAHVDFRGRARVGVMLSLWQTGLLSWGLRGAWLAARVPKLFIQPLKEAYARAQTPEEIRAYGSALTAIGHRHRRYRQAVSTFVRRSDGQGDHHLNEFRKHMAQMLVQTYESNTGGDLALFPARDAELMINRVARRDRDQEFDQQVLGLSDAQKTSLVLSLPTSLDANEHDFARSVLYLPAVARMNARDFYLPESHRSLLLTRFYHPRVAEAYLRPALTVLSRQRPAPVRSTTMPSRNEPCCCGSGKKYKRCCGLAQR